MRDHLTVFLCPHEGSEAYDTLCVQRFEKIHSVRLERVTAQDNSLRIFRYDFYKVRPEKKCAMFCMIYLKTTARNRPVGSPTCLCEGR